MEIDVGGTTFFYVEY